MEPGCDSESGLCDFPGRASCCVLPFPMLELPVLLHLRPSKKTVPQFTSRVQSIHHTSICCSNLQFGDVQMSNRCLYLMHLNLPASCHTGRHLPCSSILSLTCALSPQYLGEMCVLGLLPGRFFPPPAPKQLLLFLQSSDGFRPAQGRIFPHLCPAEADPFLLSQSSQSIAFAGGII